MPGLVPGIHALFRMSH